MRRGLFLNSSAIVASFVLQPLYSEAIAQVIPTSRPQPVQIRDRFGVDLPSGKMIYSSPEIEIGAKGAPSVAFTPVTNSGLFASETTPLLSLIQLYTCGGADGCNDFYSFWVDGETVVFPRTYSVSTAYTGETLIENDNDHFFIYRKDGSKWQFSKNIPSVGGGQRILAVGNLEKITHADGRQLEYALDTSGNIFIQSSDGYAYYQAGTVRKLVNRYSEYCSFGPSGCATTSAWPKYDGSGDALGIKTTVQVSFGSNWETTTISRPNGLVETINKTSVSLGGGGTQFIPMLVTSYASQLGNATYTYQGNSLDGIVKARSTRPGGKYVEFDKSLMSFTDEIGRSSSFGYNYFSTWGWSVRDTPSTLSSVKMPELSRSEWDYDLHGNVNKGRVVAKPSSGLSNLEIYRSFATSCPDDYRACYRPIYTLDAKEARTDYEYDSNSGLVSKITEPAGADGISPETRFTYQLLEASYIQTAGGAPQPSGKPIWKLHKKATCAAAAAPACVGTNDETVTTYGYDANLLPISETVTSGTGAVLSIITRAYDRVGNIVWEDGPAAGSTDKTYYFWDAGRRLTGKILTGPQANLVERISYNNAGLPTLIQRGTTSGTTKADLDNMAPFEEVATAYDSISRKIREEVRPFGGSPASVTQFSYDTDGNLECTAIRMNPAAFNTLPSSACALGVTGTNGPDRITKNTYDAAGQVLSTIKAYGITTANGFSDTLEQAYASYTYSPNGRKKTVVDAKGNRSEWFYDGFDRQIAWAFPSKANGASTASCTLSGVSEVSGITGPTEARNASDDCEKYAYDRNGNRAKLMKRDGQVIRYSYDALNRMTLKDLPSGSDVYYGYDLRGLQTYARFGLPNGEGITNVWDGLGRLTTSTNNMGGISRKLSYEYDSNGNRTKIVFPDEQKDGNGNVTLARHFNYEYDNLDRLIRIRENDATEIASVSYNSRGERTDIGGGFNTHFAYDGISRLARITHNMTSAGQAVTFCMGTMSGETCNPSYNAAGQILNRTITNSGYIFNNYWNFVRTHEVNGLNQYTSVSGKERNYDDNGNMTYDAGSDKTGPVTYTYDVENRLTGASGADNVTLSYDPLGRLYQTVDASRSPPGNTTRFLYDGDELVAEYDGNNEMVHRYVHGSGTDDPLVWYMGSGLGSRYHLRTDHQGSIVAISNSAGASVAINSYDEYGVAGLRNLGRFGYTGQTIIPELGLNYYKARIYSPTLGRFLQTDPIGYDDQINLYAYVANDPVNRIDPAGMYDCVGTTGQCSFIKEAYETILAASYSEKLRPSQRSMLRDITQTLGKPGEKNGVEVTFGVPKAGDTALGAAEPTSLGKGEITINYDEIVERFGSNKETLLDAGARVLAHEGGHVWFGSTGGKLGATMNSERFSYTADNAVITALGGKAASPGEIESRAIRSCAGGDFTLSTCAMMSSKQRK